jgi:hypothetical protein
MGAVEGRPNGDTVHELSGTVTGRLPASGPPMENVRAERNRDYPADTDLIYGRGGTDFRTRFTPGDRRAVIAALSQDSLKGLRASARAAGLSGRGHGTALADHLVGLVMAAHAAGYRLCYEDRRQLRQDSADVRDYLLGLAERRDGEPGGMAHRDVEALERVIAMLEEK